jgi:hypothetical protein
MHKNISKIMDKLGISVMDHDKNKLDNLPDKVILNDLKAIALRLGFNEQSLTYKEIVKESKKKIYKSKK